MTARQVGAAEAPEALARLLEARPLREPVALVGIDGGGGTDKSTRPEATVDLIVLG